MTASRAALASNFLQQLYAAGTYWVLYLLGVMLILLTPAVIGLFWGAPLIARELVFRPGRSARQDDGIAPQCSVLVSGESCCFKNIYFVQTNCSTWASL